MSRPFYTVPSPSALRDEVAALLENPKSWKKPTIDRLKRLDEFAGKSAKAIREQGATRSQLQRAIALDYEAADWSDLLFLSETMEHDDFMQLANRAKFLCNDHVAGLPIACMRLRKALPQFKGKSNRQILNSTLSLADAQRTIAKEYGMDSWVALKKFVRSHPATEGFLNTPDAMPPAVARLVDAVDTGDVDRVKQSLAENPSLVHARVASDITCGDTLLHRADPRATNGSRMTPAHLEVAQLLIDNGIDINAMGGCGDSCFTPPLDASVWIGNQKMVALLLKNYADPNRSYWSMTKPVTTAANHNGRATFKMLVEAGADYTLYETVKLKQLKLTRELLNQNPETVNLPCEDSVPMVLATDDIKMTRLLLRMGGDPNISDSREVSPLMAAIQAGNKEVIDTLQEHGAQRDIFAFIGLADRRGVARMLEADPTSHQSKHVTPLIWAVTSGDKKIVEMLLEHGADPNEQQRRWMQDNPLVAACSYHRDEMILSLLAAGAKPNVTGPYSWSKPLVSAVRWGTRRAVQLLLEGGANPSETNEGQVIGCPLGWVAYVGKLIESDMLLRAGANKTARSLALIAAASDRRLAMIEQLGTLDTDLNYATERGDAMRHAKANRQPAAMAHLQELREIQALPKSKRESILKPRADFVRFVCTNDGRSLSKLINRYPDLVARDLVHGELFHHAAGTLQTSADKTPLLSVVKVLVKNGVPWTMQSAVACDQRDEVVRLLGERGATKVGLHAAAKFNNVALLERFLDSGVEINTKESWGTALHEAVRYRSLDVVKVLLERGANVNATDQNGNTPRQLCYGGHKTQKRIAAELDAHGATR